MTPYRPTLFDSGKVHVTRACLAAVGNPDLLKLPLIQHCTGQWGDVSALTADNNRKALISGGFVQSRHVLNGVIFWIITEAGWSSTVILLDSETHNLASIISTLT